MFFLYEIEKNNLSLRGAAEPGRPKVDNYDNSMERVLSLRINIIDL